MIHRRIIEVRHEYYSTIVYEDNKNRYRFSVTAPTRNKLVDLLKEMRFSVNSLRPVEDAIITSGGINVKEINPKTMESKICKGLYFAGEVIDVDAYTGGFNLQIAFSTGYLAGNNA